MNRFALAWAAALAIGACGSDSDELVCGDGTMEFDGQCVVVDPGDETAPTTVAAPDPGSFRELSVVVLATDEPATIFYTTDGSDPTSSSESGASPVTITSPNGTIKYFAVDLAGNEESVQEGTWEIDVEGPGPVENLTSAVVNTDVSASWELPTDGDYAGVVVARSLARSIDEDPTDGIAVSVGDSIAEGLEVVFVGDATSSTEAAAASGVYQYRVWTFDNLNNYSVARTTSAIQPDVGAQDATLSVDLAGQTVTVMTSPSGYTLAGTAVFDSVNSTLDVTLDLTNDLGRHVFVPKAVTTSVNEGTQVGTSTVRGLPFVRYGRALDVGSTTQRVLSFTGITGATDPILIDLSIEDAPILVSARDVADSVAPNGVFDDPVNGKNAAISADGRLIYALEKDEPSIRLGDLVTGQDIGDVAFDIAGGSYGGIAVTGASIFVAFNAGAHYKGSDGSDFAEADTNVFIRELDPVTFEVRRELALITAGTGKAAHQIQISADGTTLAVPVSTINGQGNEIWFVNLADFSILDADAGTAGDQPVILRVAGQIDHSTWSEDGATYYAAYNNHNDGRNDGPGVSLPIDVIDMSDFSVTQLTPASAFSASAGILEKAGKVYYLTGHGGGTNELSVFDAAGVETASSPFGNAVRGGMVFDNTGTRYFATSGRDGSTLAAFSVADDTEVDLDDDAGNGTTRYSLNARRSYLLLTPF